MKTSLPERSQPFAEAINQIRDIILKVAEDKIAFIILFGSFARGTWVRDRYSEGNAVYEYFSDYDFLIIKKSHKKPRSVGASGARPLGDKEEIKLVESGISDFDLEHKIRREVRGSHNPHFVIEPIDYVNSELEKGRYFFSDIKKEGILLYSSGDFQLAEPKVLSEQEVREIAREDYGHWMKKAEGFFIDCNNAFKREDFCLSAFHLHQTTESLYNCALLVLTGYKPKSHDLQQLNRLASSQSNDFLTVFPLATEEQQESFKLLNKSYIEARYNKHFTIAKSQLEYLIKKVEGLKVLVERVCGERI